MPNKTYTVTWKYAEGPESRVVRTSTARAANEANARALVRGSQRRKIVIKSVKLGRAR